MTIENNHCIWQKKINEGGPHLTITFMKSLASDYGNKAIGVILQVIWRYRRRKED
jgi:hypothetical protein